MPLWDVKERGVAEGRALNATAASLLGFLHDGPLSGYQLAATAQGAIGEFWSLTQSQIYRELAWMADAGLVTAGERGTRQRRPYTLTPGGRAAFAGWVERTPGPETIRHPLLLTLRFGRHVPPDRLAAFIRQHRETHAERLRAYEVAAAALAEHPRSDDDAPFVDATLAFGIAYEQAVVDWFASLPATIVDPAQPSAPTTDERP
jgi:DNA-binding PadR family transcriptional regulator